MDFAFDGRKILHQLKFTLTILAVVIFPIVVSTFFRDVFVVFTIRAVVTKLRNFLVYWSQLCSVPLHYLLPFLFNFKKFFGKLFCVHLETYKRDSVRLSPRQS